MKARHSVFLIATMALLITPGPAVLYIVARSIDQGRPAGIVSVLGIGVGTLFHVVAAALGLSALLATSALAFNAVKYLGAAYLIYLGVQKLLAREESPTVGTPERQKLSRIFSGGIIVNSGCQPPPRARSQANRAVSPAGRRHKLWGCRAAVCSLRAHAHTGSC